MARLPLNKTTLGHQKRRLETFRRFLPSLDLRRRQLIAARNHAIAALREARRDSDAIRAAAETVIPMLADRGIAVEGLVSVDGVEIGEQNLMGVRLPRVDSVAVTVAAYGLLVKPHWVDRATELLRAAAEAHLRAQVAERRVGLLDIAVRKVTQRVNLFEKVLIPRARADIKRISIFLSDNERAGVVASKIAKARHAGTGVAP